MWTKPITASAIAVGTLLGGAGSAMAATTGTGSTPLPPVTSTTVPTTPPVGDPCSSDAHWPAFVQGFPSSFDAHDDGAYIGHRPEGGWGLRVSHPLGINKPVEVTFSGTIATQGEFSAVKRVQDEKNDMVKVSHDGHVLTYDFHNYGWVDGIDFVLSCPNPVVTPPTPTSAASTTTPALGSLGFDLKADGHTMPTRYIHLGLTKVNPGSDPFLIRRVDTDTTTQPMPPVTSGSSGASSTGTGSGTSTSTGSTTSSAPTA